MPRKVKDLALEIPELQAKLGHTVQTAKELREMGAKAIRALEKALLKEEKELEEAEKEAVKTVAMSPAPRVKALVAAAKAKKAAAGGAGGGAAASLVTSEETKVLDQTESAFLPGAVAASTKRLVAGAKSAPSTLKQAEDAVEGVGIKVIKKAKAPRKAKVSEAKEVAKVVREVESETKLLEAEKKGLLRSKEAKQKARDIRFAKASSEEAAEMQVKEGAAKAKALLGKVKEKVVEKVAERKKRVRKAQHMMPDGSMMDGAKHPEKKPRKTPLRTHKIAAEAAPVVPALGHPRDVVVHKVHHKYPSGMDRELLRIGIAV